MNYLLIIIGLCIGLALGYFTSMNEKPIPKTYYFEKIIQKDGKDFKVAGVVVGFKKGIMKGDKDLILTEKVVEKGKWYTLSTEIKLSDDMNVNVFNEKFKSAMGSIMPKGQFLYLDDFKLIPANPRLITNGDMEKVDTVTNKPQTK